MRPGWIVAAALLALAQPAAAAGDRPGQRFEISPDRLPAPYATPSSGNSASRMRRPADATLEVPAGFKVNVFADRLDHARWMTVAPNGDVLLAEPRDGKVTLLRDSDKDGRADTVTTFADGFDRPHGLAIHDGYLYVGDVREVWRVPYKVGDTKAGGKRELVGSEGALGSGGGHWTRNIAFSPDGSHFFVSVGSAGNIDVERAPRATVQAFKADGSGQRTFASGLRNAVGIAFYPGTSDLYVVVNERDGMGDGLVPDYLTRIRDGGFYGWPYSYIGSHPQPDYAERAPEMVKKAIVPDLLFESHSAPLGLVFYQGGQFPVAYRGGAFVALHGSWNSGKPTGYKVVFVPFKDRRPAGYYENFATGFWAGGTSRAQVWGRPAGLAVAGDGSLLVADDVGQTIWRISYAK
jgi:glucose/arabinose dehydrogenase